MARRRAEDKRPRKQLGIEKQYEQYFTPFHQVLLGPEGLLAQPSPYLNIWGIQASDAGGEPIVTDLPDSRSSL